ncbi:hypothetical protein JTE90_007621 [Oedothorax gibbosus]|uniref:Uncharacterized protein n=1 Tax=Oedothorax gibbosus TaxID=931172 RepID=A0AAV6U627_9ARAC|nr:hypothetical protein JTE90_007621 [Oedothorax gibbosus]
MSQDNINRTQSQPLRNPLNLRNLTNNTFSMFDVRNWYNIWAESVQNDENAGPVTTIGSCPLCQTNVEDSRLSLRPAEYEGSPCFVCARTPGFTEPGQTGGWIFVPNIEEIIDESRMEVGLQTPNDEQQPPNVEGQSPEVEQQTPRYETTTTTETSKVPKTKNAAKSSTVRKTPTTSKPTKRKAASPASKSTKK